MASLGSALPIQTDEFERLWALAPPQKPTSIVCGHYFPRYTAAYGNDYTFSGQTAIAQDAPSAPGYEHYTHWMMNAGLNGILVNWYNAAQRDYIGPHSDDEINLCENTPIVSITFCSNDTHYRRFRLTCQA